MTWLPNIPTTNEATTTENFQELEKRLIVGIGTPEGRVGAPVGAIYLRLDGGVGSTFYVKESAASPRDTSGWATGGGGGEGPQGKEGKEGPQGKEGKEGPQGKVSIGSLTKYSESLAGGKEYEVSPTSAVKMILQVFMKTEKEKIGTLELKINGTALAVSGKAFAFPTSNNGQLIFPVTFDLEEKGKFIVNFAGAIETVAAWYETI